MSSVLKRSFLFVLLVVPVGIYLFLEVFGENRYEKIPVFYQDGVTSTLESCDFGKGQHVVPDFSFLNQDRETIDQNILDGNITVANFFFTSCPNICPRMSDQMSRVQEAFKDNSAVKILSFTVDPEHDDPEVLKTYSEEYRAGEQWHFLTGEKKDLYKLARCGFLLPVQDGEGDPLDFIHSERFVLLDGQKRIRGYFNGTDREEVDRLIIELQILMR